MDTQALIAALGSSAPALVIFYFYVQYRTDVQKRIDDLEAEVKDLRKMHDDDLRSLARRRSGDTARLPELAPDEVAKAKKHMEE